MSPDPDRALGRRRVHPGPPRPRPRSRRRGDQLRPDRGREGRPPAAGEGVVAGAEEPGQPAQGRRPDARAVAVHVHQHLQRGARPRAVRALPRPGVRGIFWESAFASLKPGHQGSYVDYENADRPPLLFISGSDDHLMPPAVRGRTPSTTGLDTVTEVWEFEGPHLLPSQGGLAGGRRLRPGLGRGAGRRTRLSLRITHIGGGGGIAGLGEKVTSAWRRHSQRRPTRRGPSQMHQGRIRTRGTCRLQGGGRRPCVPHDGVHGTRSVLRMRSRPTSTPGGAPR